jgi:hypothetical protein
MMIRFLTLIALLWLLPAPVNAQAIGQVRAPVYAPMPAPNYRPLWNPVADYVTLGQDEPGYRYWYASGQYRPFYVQAFNQYLTTYGVGGIAPTWQLLRTASDWQKCGADPFEIPPTSEWPNIVNTLRYIRDRIVPVMGPVEPVSVYRNPRLNACAGGAVTSTHREMGAVDLVPLRPITREALMSGLCAIHRAVPSNVGLGFYKGLRFHVDSRKYRDWGMTGAHGGYGCAAVLAEGAAPFVPEPAAATTLAQPAVTNPLAAPAPH